MSHPLAAITDSIHSPGKAEAERIAFGDFVLFPLARLLYRRGVPLDLGSRKLDILCTLAARAGQVVTNRELISAAWRGLVVDHGNLRVQITGLRKALGDGVKGARYIANVRGQGYSFVAPVERSNPGREPPRTSPPRSPAFQELLDAIAFAIGVPLDVELTLADLVERLSRGRTLELPR
jgi:DNA-binding winged helix-turn-helix (wHTH) protein